MGKKSRLSHDQKRKAKRAKDARRAQAATSSLAYTGNKYKKDAYVPLMFATEQGIYEAYEMTREQLTDQEVRDALEELILGLRQDTLPPLDSTEEIAADSEKAMVVWNVRRHWELLKDEEPQFGTEDRIGVLRTLLNSLATWGSPSPHSRGYLHFLEGFMKRAGVNVTAVDQDQEPAEEEQEDAMLDVGREWCLEGDDESARTFRDWAAQAIRSGEGERVADICQQLLGELGNTRDMGLVNELSALALQGQRAMPKD
jgi:hypothetical protein